jgi:hypothetical protein
MAMRTACFQITVPVLQAARPRGFHEGLPHRVEQVAAHDAD